MTNNAPMAYYIALLGAIAAGDPSAGFDPVELSFVARRTVGVPSPSTGCMPPTCQTSFDGLELMMRPSVERATVR